jgi:hypothetical protein
MWHSLRMIGNSVSPFAAKAIFTLIAGRSEMGNRSQIAAEWATLVDRMSPERRSSLMSRVKGKHTEPELRVRRAAHAEGLRFRLHREDLPGKPDLIFPRRRIALFVHGVFGTGIPDAGKGPSPVRASGIGARHSTLTLHGTTAHRPN